MSSFLGRGQRVRGGVRGLHQALRDDEGAAGGERVPSRRPGRRRRRDRLKQVVLQKLGASAERSVQAKVSGSFGFFLFFVYRTNLPPISLEFPCPPLTVFKLFEMTTLFFRLNKTLQNISLAYCYFLQGPFL